MTIFESVIELLSALTLLDYILFFSVVFLMVLIVILIYFIKVNHLVEKSQITEQKTSDTSTPTEIISFEQEQEQKAIISYEELKSKIETKPSITYEEEREIDGLTIKKINLEESKIDEYTKEEEFLEIIKRLSKK